MNLTNHVQACGNITDKWDCFHKTIAGGVNLCPCEEEICC